MSVTSTTFGWVGCAVKEPVMLPKAARGSAAESAPASAYEPAIPPRAAPRVNFFARRERYCQAQLAGTVSTGACGVTPVSAREKKISRNEKIRFEAMSSSSIQYQVPR